MREFLPLPDHRTMAVLGRDGALRLEERTIPPLASGDLCFRLLSAGLSREDLDPTVHAERVPPGIPVGEIVATGDGVRGWAPFDRALLLSPLNPELRLEGLASFIHVPKALVAAQSVVKLGLEMPPDSATLLPAAAFAARLLAMARVPAGGSLLVLGLPLVAQILVLLARHQKVETLFAVDPSATLRRRAEWSGATLVFSPEEAGIRDTVLRATHGAGVTGAVVVASEATWIHEVLQSLALRGTLVLAAAQDPRLVIALPGGWVVRRELRIEGVLGFDRKYLKEARQALELGIVNVDTLVSRRVPWTDLSAFRPEADYWQHGLHLVVDGPEN